MHNKLTSIKEIVVEKCWVSWYGGCGKNRSGFALKGSIWKRKSAAVFGGYFLIKL